MSRQRIVFMFSGMGSQYHQMGWDLFEKDPAFARWMRHFDGRVTATGRPSVIEEIYRSGRKRGDELGDQKRAAAALLTVECATAHTLLERGIEPDLLLGASLGESAAGIVSGALRFEEMVELFSRHDDAIADACEEATLMGVFLDPAALARDEFLRERCEIAAFNLPEYVAVAVKLRDRDEVVAHLGRRNVVHQAIGVQHGFHTSIIEPAEGACRRAVRGIHRAAPRIPIVSCASSRTVEEFDDAHFWSVLRSPIYFHRTLRAVEEQGEAIYIDVGPAGTLASYAQHVLGKGGSGRVHPILTMFGRDTRGLSRVEAAVSQQRSAKRGRVMKAVVFPGQGAQQKGMGKELFEAFPAQTAEASEILGYDIARLCLEDPNKELRRTQFTQPALFVVGALAYQRWRASSGRDPDFAAGHSLGEYDALFAAGAFDFATGVKLVKRRGELMAQARGGSMAAVVGLDAGAIAQLLERNDLRALDVANFNTPQQTVLSGPGSELDRAAPFFEKAGARYVRLDVSAAFHSRYMEPAAREFEAFLGGFSFQPLAFPVIANTQALPYAAADVAATLAAQLRSPVRWCDSIRYLLAQGELEFEELGHGTVLTRLIREIRSAAVPQAPVSAAPPPKASSVPGGTAATRVAPATEERAPSRRQVGEGGRLGSDEFRREHDVGYAYYAGAMGSGVSGVQLVERLARAGVLGVLGTGGLDERDVEAMLQALKQQLPAKQPFAVSLSPTADEERRLDQLFRHDVRVVEAGEYVALTPALVRFRLHGVRRLADGTVRVPNRIIGVVSRLELARAFLEAPPPKLVADLVQRGKLGAEEAKLAVEVSMASDVCVRGDSAWTTDRGSALAMLPAFLRAREEYRPGSPARMVRVGVAGGLGTPEAIAAAFLLGAEFVCTGSVNQCTAEAATSGLVKELLSKAQIHDTTLVPDEALFELGGRAQVLKRGVFFPARANRLHELYRALGSLEELEATDRQLLEEKCFGKRLELVRQEVMEAAPRELREAAERNPKIQMALVFRAFLARSAALAREGNVADRVQFSIPCSAAMGAFNAWAKGSSLEDWRGRHVDEIATRLMDDAAVYLARRTRALLAAEGDDRGRAGEARSEHRHVAPAPAAA